MMAIWTFERFNLTLLMSCSYFSSFSSNRRCIFYLITDFSLIQTLCLAPLVSILMGFDCTYIPSIISNITNKKNMLWKTFSLKSWPKTHNFNPSQSSASLSIRTYVCICCAVNIFFNYNVFSDSFYFEVFSTVMILINVLNN